MKLHCVSMSEVHSNDQRHEPDTPHDLDGSCGRAISLDEAPQDGDADKPNELQHGTQGRGAQELNEKGESARIACCLTVELSGAHANA
jgi:hypothetical protein